MDVGKRKTWVHVWFLVRQRRTGAPIDYMAIAWEEPIQLLRECRWSGEGRRARHRCHWHHRAPLDTPESGFSTAIPKLTVRKMRGVPGGVGKTQTLRQRPRLSRTQSGVPKISQHLGTCACQQNCFDVLAGAGRDDGCAQQPKPRSRAAGRTGSTTCEEILFRLIENVQRAVATHFRSMPTTGHFSMMRLPRTPSRGFKLTFIGANCGGRRRADHRTMGSQGPQGRGRNTGGCLAHHGYQSKNTAITPTAFIPATSFSRVSN
jgi:hypothetical protein